ncbi:MAG: NAD-dependent epimerase/dehydratase family protein [bacterium]
MFVAPDLHLLIPDPSPRSELDVFVSMKAYQRTITEWQRLFQDSPDNFREFLQMTFGSEPEVIERRCALYARVLECAAEALGAQTAVWLVGSPSRINWEGHHVDHQGGWYNATTDENEVVAVVAERSDSIVRLFNIDPQFPESSFSLREGEAKREGEAPAEPKYDSRKARRGPHLRPNGLKLNRQRVGKKKSIWADYAKGAFLAVLDRFPIQTPLGADLVVGGDIPVGTGQSSSHALCVVSVLAAVAANGLRLRKRSAVICAQEAEWFAGSRTGLGDQATMIFGQRDKLMASPVIEEESIDPQYVDLSPDIVRVIVDSFTIHRLQGHQRIGYTGRVCAYRIAFPFLLNALLDFGAQSEDVLQTRYLADVNPDRFPLTVIYSALLRTPLAMPLAEIRNRLEDISSRLCRLGKDLDINLDNLLETYFGSGPYPDSLEIRGIALYGLSECRRSALCAGLLSEGRFEDACSLITTGHDGDRVIRQDKTGRYVPVHHDVSDQCLQNLLDDLRSGDEARIAAAQLEKQPGAYGASHPLLDRLVDACLAGGAMCASLTGGGLGGVVTILIQQNNFDALQHRVLKGYLEEQERSLLWCDSESFARAVGNDYYTQKHRDRLAGLWSRKQESLKAGIGWQPADEDRHLIDRLTELVSKADPSIHEIPSFHLFQVDETVNGIRLNHSIDGAGFLHPPVQTDDREEIWRERVTSDLRSQERAALQTKDWNTIERLALQQRNIAYRKIRFARRAPAGTVTGETFLVTGGAGFIGASLTKRLLEEGHRVVVLDDFNDYYDPFLKYENIRPILDHPAFDLFEGDFRDPDVVERVFTRHRIDQIIHLGARAGIRPSIEDPPLYVTTNVLGIQNLLEMARRFSVRNFVYASSSSVYGGSKQCPFSESQSVDHPVSPYAATKKANEVQASCYHQLYGFPVTGLRFFTVYGPGGRPDMAIRKFIERLSQGKPVPMYGDGSFKRDFTYIDDVVDGILGAIRASAGKEDWDEVLNLGESETTTVREMILLIADSLGVVQLERDPKGLSEEEVEALIEELKSKGLIEILPEQLGDVPLTCADISKAADLINYNPQTKIQEGIKKTVQWHRRCADESPLISSWNEALRAYIEMSQRAGLDSYGRQRDPLYSQQDLTRMLDVRDRIECLESMDRTRKIPGPWILAGVCRVIGEIAAYLRSDMDRLWGMTGLLVHRSRLAILDRIHTAADRPLTEEEEESILRKANEIIQLCGLRKAALVVAAAGLGTRIAKEVGGYEQKHKLFFGDDMLLLSLRNMIAFANRIVVVASENNHRDIAELLERSEINEDNGFSAEFVIQKERLGDGDAHLTAAEVLENFGGIVLFVFSDAPTKSGETIAKMVALKQALGHLVPLVVPSIIRESPYAPIVVAHDGPDRGSVIWNWQKADETEFEKARQLRSGRGATNVGIFAAEPIVFSILRDFKERLFFRTTRYEAWKKKMEEWEKAGADLSQRPKSPEFGFADLMKSLASQGGIVVAPPIANERDRLNVNSSDGADAVRELYRKTCPQVRVHVEKREGRGEVIVRFVDVDADGNTIIVNGLPRYRNYTRLRFGQREDLSSSDIEKAINEHIKSISERIESEMGLRVLRD